jgi:hypothetical protein
MVMNPDKTNARWPFDPMQPGDHEPARLPEELERVQKQTGHSTPQPSPDYRKSEEERK